MVTNTSRIAPSLGRPHRVVAERDRKDLGVDDGAEHRRLAQQQPVCRGEHVEARGHERLDRVGQRIAVALLRGGVHELDDEQRVSAGTLDEPIPVVRPQVAVLAGDGRREFECRGGIQRFQIDDRVHRRRQGIEQRCSRTACHQHRPRPFGDVVEHGAERVADASSIHCMSSITSRDGVRTAAVSRSATARCVRSRRNAAAIRSASAVGATIGVGDEAHERQPWQLLGCDSLNPFGQRSTRVVGRRDEREPDSVRNSRRNTKYGEDRAY